MFIGTGAFGIPSLRALAARPDLVTLVGVVTAPPRPAGRHHELRESPVHVAARALGVVPILCPDRLRRPEAIGAVLALRPELIVLADYGQIVPSALLDPPHGALNLHPSLLPRHRGAAPVGATILAGDARTGVSLMRMDAGLDTGPLLAVSEVPLVGDETAPELEERLAGLASRVLLDALEPWLLGQSATRPQADAGATLTRPLRRADGWLDPSRPATVLERQVRAYQPWPGSWLETPAGRLTVWAARPLRGATGRPGELVRAGDGLALVTADGLLELLEVQPAGGRRMQAAAFLRGHPGVVGG